MKEVRARHGQEGSEGTPGRRSKCVGSRRARTSLYCTPTTACQPLCPRSVCTCRLVLCWQPQIGTRASENQSHLPKVTQPGLGWHPELRGLQSRALCLRAHTAPRGQGLLELCKEWARLCLCRAERRNQLPTLRPTAHPSQPDQRPAGSRCSFLPWPLGSSARHAPPPITTPAVVREGPLHLVPPRGAWGTRGAMRGCSAEEKLSPSAAALGPGWC